MRKIVSIPLAALAISVLLGSNAVAQDAKSKKEPRPALFQKLVDCRAITDAAQRLACYDSSVAQIDEAESKSEVVIVDKSQVRKARKSLFGFSLPKIGLFGGDDDKADEADTLESTLKSARLLGNGKWFFVLEDGAKWVQIDDKSIRDAKPGNSIKIRRAAMGSFLANVNGQVAIRVRREN
jgi:hypothetical protein